MECIIIGGTWNVLLFEEHGMYYYWRNMKCIIIGGTWNVLLLEEHGMYYYWRNMECIRQKQGQLKNSLECIIDGKTVFNTPKVIVNGFNKYFTEVGQCLLSNISSGSGSIYDYLNRDSNNSMYLKIVQHRKLQKLQRNKKIKNLWIQID